MKTDYFKPKKRIDDNDWTELSFFLLLHQESCPQISWSNTVHLPTKLGGFILDIFYFTNKSPNPFFLCKQYETLFVFLLSPHVEVVCILVGWGTFSRRMITTVTLCFNVHMDSGLLETLNEKLWTILKRITDEGVYLMMLNYVLGTFQMRSGPEVPGLGTSVRPRLIAEVIQWKTVIPQNGWRREVDALQINVLYFYISQVTAVVIIEE